MANVFDIKKDWDKNLPAFRNTASRVLNSANSATPSIHNPFLDKNGEIVNPYINYRAVLDNPGVSSKVKAFIENATGLSPTQSSTGKSYVEPTQYENTASSAAESNSSIVSAAEKYIGTPYVWGGSSAAQGGMDCSGFVYNALKDAGYDVGRTTAQGYRSYGSTVSKSDMQPGDLVFFGKNNNASHIGIYIGNGQMIHSAGKGQENTKSNPGKGVSVANVDYRNDFLEARRY